MKIYPTKWGTIGIITRIVKNGTTGEMHLEGGRVDGTWERVENAIVKEGKIYFLDDDGNVISPA